MIQLVYDILKQTRIPTKYIFRPQIDSLNKIGISYHFFNEGYGFYGDGVGKEYGGSMQVDVFSLIDHTDKIKEIINLLKNNRFRLADMRDGDSDFEESLYYHKILVFNFTEREVMR